MLAYVANASRQQLTSFLNARISHIYDHLNGTTGPHTVCMPQDFTRAIGHLQPEHWLVDYQYLHRLLRLFPGMIIQ